MTARDSAAAELAERMGWGLRVDGASGTIVFRAKSGRIGPLPAPEADLSRHLQFVGRIAEALAPRGWRLDGVVHWTGTRGGPDRWRVALKDIDPRQPGFAYHFATDPSWAALLAAAAALAGKEPA